MNELHHFVFQHHFRSSHTPLSLIPVVLSIVVCLLQSLQATLCTLARFHQQRIEQVTAGLRVSVYPAQKAEQGEEQRREGRDEGREEEYRSEWEARGVFLVKNRILVVTRSSAPSLLLPFHVILSIRFPRHCLEATIPPDTMSN